MPPAKKRVKSEDDVDEDAEKDEEEEAEESNEEVHHDEEEEDEDDGDETRIRLPLTSEQAKELVAFLTRPDPSTLKKKEIQTIQKQLSEVDSHLEEILNMTSRNQWKLDQWRKFWEESLKEYNIESETAESTKQLLDWVCSHIITGPSRSDYGVPAKHGDVINYALLSFETLESDGSKQKILVEHYGFNYDSETGLRLYSKEIDKKDVTFAEHRAHISKHELPDKVPEDGGSFLGSDQIGKAFFKDGDYLKFKEIMKTRKVWQVILGMINFYGDGWKQMY